MRRLLLLTFIPAILWVMMICGFSGESGQQSSSLSLRVTNGFVDIVGCFNDLSDQEHEKLVEKLHTPVRKLAHMTEYAILFVLIYIPVLLNFKGVLPDRSMGLWVISLVLCMVCAGSDEIHQLFVPGRDGRLADVVIDTSGAAVGGLISAGIHKIANAKKIRKGK